MPAQSAFALHSTHEPAATRHFGVGALHWASVVQPAARQTPSSASQRGVAGEPEQSAFVMHWTHLPSVRLQCGAATPQSAFVVQPVH